MSENYTVTMKQGDLGPALRAHVTNDSDGQSPDFTGATITLKLLQLDPATGELVEVFAKPASVELPSTTGGVLRYDWEAGDTDAVGRYQALFKVVTPGAVPEHYPDSGYIWITVEDAGPNP